jgi:hypothetical protein
MVYCSAQSDLVGQRWAVSPDVVRGEVVPDRQQRLFACDGAGDQAIEFVIGPTLAEEGVGKNDNAVPTRADAVVDLATQAVPYPQLSFIEPYSDAESREGVP